MIEHNVTAAGMIFLFIDIIPVYCTKNPVQDFEECTYTNNLPCICLATSSYLINYAENVPCEYLKSLMNGNVGKAKCEQDYYCNTIGPRSILNSG